MLPCCCLIAREFAIHGSINYAWWVIGTLKFRTWEPPLCNHLWFCPVYVSKFCRVWLFVKATTRKSQDFVSPLACSSVATCQGDLGRLWAAVVRFNRATWHQALRASGHHPQASIKVAKCWARWCKLVHKARKASWRSLEKLDVLLAGWQELAWNSGMGCKFWCRMQCLYS